MFFVWGVGNEPIPIGEGKEYLDGMNKMKAFMAGRLYQESLKSNEA